VHLRVPPEHRLALPESRGAKIAEKEPRSIARMADAPRRIRPLEVCAPLDAPPPSKQVYFFPRFSCFSHLNSDNMRQRIYIP
jgi:hypothetical protein